MPVRTNSGLIDWREVGIDLRRFGFGPSRVAAALNRPKSTVDAWLLYGSEPGFTDGHRMLELWAAVTRHETPRKPFAVTLPLSRHKGNALAAI